MFNVFCVWSIQTQYTVKTWSSAYGYITGRLRVHYGYITGSGTPNVPIIYPLSTRIDLREY